MGYPFDRRARPNVSNLDTFLTPNMITKPITIIHSDAGEECQVSQTANIRNDPPRRDTTSTEPVNEVNS